MAFRQATQTTQSAEAAATTRISAATQQAAVIVAAERLLAELENADKLTQRWNDQALGQSQVDAALDRCIAALAATGLVGRDNQLASNDFWKIAGPMLACGDLQNRARTKPLGYAGDFTMLEDFWLRRETADPPGRLFDRYFLKQQAVEAVRGRMEAAAEEIAERCWATKQGEFRVVSVGSGPAIDLELAAKSLPSDARARLRFTLVDIDDDALQCAQARLAAVMPPGQVRAYRENLFRLAKNKRKAEIFAEADIVLCTGLFDYLAEADAATMLHLFWSGLRAGGAMFVGNFAPHCPSRAYMEWIGNWYLIYRTYDDLEHLAAAAGFSATQVRIGAERTGCDLFLIAER